MRVASSIGLVATLLGAAACSAQVEQAAPRRHVVEIRGFEFHAVDSLVAAGDTIVWKNLDMVPHTATAAAGDWDSGPIAAGSEWVRVVDGNGNVQFYCALHPTMRGQITTERDAQ